MNSLSYNGTVDPPDVSYKNLDDVVIDTSELMAVIIDLWTAAGGYYAGLDPGDITVYNLDDEIAPQVLKLVTPLF